MAIFDSFKSAFARTRDKPLPTGRKSVAGTSYGNKTLSPYRSRTHHVLHHLRHIQDEAGAIVYLREKNADVSMAVWNFIRLANQGHEMKFYDIRNKANRLTEVEDRWREFAARVNEISNSGLDGLIDQFHQSAYMLGAQGAEVEVSADRRDVIDVYPVIPQTITWEYETRNGRKMWIPYQQQYMEKVSLEPGKANFFWVPTDPMIDDPRGTLILTPAIQAVDFQMQILQDLQAVLHHQGWPRNDIKILLERLLTAMPPQIKSQGPEKQEEWLTKQWNNIVDMFNKLDPDSDYIHYDDIEVNLAQGANAGRSLDVRAISELVDTSIMSGAKQMSIFMNRNSGITESWGTVQFRIFCSGIASIQRGSKRLVEEIARLWLRVNGIQASPVFTHNTIDWESEEQRMTVRLLQEKFWAIAKLMNWCDNDRAAQETIGTEKAVSPDVSETVRASFSIGGEDVGRGQNKETQKTTGGRRSQEELLEEP